MLNLRSFVSSWSLDSRKDSSDGPWANVHRALSETPPLVASAPRHLRARVMDRIYEMEPVAQSRPAGAWRRAGLAAAAVVAVGAGVYVLVRPATTRDRGAEPLMSLHVPVDVGPMVRLVALNVDQPLLDQAQKMMSDTRRATEAVVRCIPFVRGDSRP
jgi:hypothetical protein